MDDSGPQDIRELDGHEIEDLSDGLRTLARTLVGSEVLADDLVQEAWVAALGRPAGPLRSLRAWMGGVMRNVAIDSKARRRRGEDLEQLMAARNAVVEPAPATVAEEEFDVLRSAAEAVPEPYRAVIVARFFGDASIEEIAADLGRPVSTVRSQVSRGVSKLREVLNSRFGGRSNWSGLLVPLALRGMPGVTARSAMRASAGTSSTSASGALMFVLIFVVAAVSLAGFYFLRDPGRAGRSDEVVSLERDAIDPLTREESGALDAASLDEGDTRVSEEAPVSAVDVDAPAGVAAPALAAVAERSYRVLVDVVHQDRLPATDLVLTLRRSDRFKREIRSATSPVEVIVLQSETITVDGAPHAMINARSGAEATSLTAVVALDVDKERRFELATRGPSTPILIQVQDKKGGPVADALVVVGPNGRQGRFGAGPGVVLTDQGDDWKTRADGVVAFQGLPQTSRRLQVIAPGFVPVDRVVQIADAPERIDITLDRGSELHGTVQLPDGRPAMGAVVRVVDALQKLRGVEPPSAVAGEDGSFVLGGLGRKAVHVFATIEGEGEEMPLHAATSIRPKRRTPEVWEARLELHGGLRVRFTYPDGKPIPGSRAILFVPGSGRTAPPPFSDLQITDEDGAAHYRFLPAFPVQLMIERAQGDVIACEGTIEFDPNDDSVREVIVPFSPGTAGAITGVIRDPSGNPPPLGQLRGSRDGELFHADIDPRTARAEAFELHPGTYDLHVMLGEFGAVPLGKRTLEPGGQLDLGDVTLPALVNVSVIWGHFSPTKDDSWTVVYDVEGGHEGMIPVRAFTSREEAISLVPGRYHFHRQSNGQCSIFEVPEGVSLIELVLPGGK